MKEIFFHPFNQFVLHSNLGLRIINNTKTAKGKGLFLTFYAINQYFHNKIIRRFEWQKHTLNGRPICKINNLRSFKYNVPDLGQWRWLWTKQHQQESFQEVLQSSQTGQTLDHYHSRPQSWRTPRNQLSSNCCLSELPAERDSREKKLNCCCLRSQFCAVHRINSVFN